MNGIRILAVLAVALAGGHAAAQQKSLRDQIVGTWDFGVAEVIAPDGKKSFPFGETPKGVLIFTADGHFAQIHVASDVPKIASGNRLTGTPGGIVIVEKVGHRVRYHRPIQGMVGSIRQAQCRSGWIIAFPDCYYSFSIPKFIGIYLSPAIRLVKF
jgi:hypothetical protein